MVVETIQPPQVVIFQSEMVEVLKGAHFLGGLLSYCMCQIFFFNN
jgi:hypothetical protein